MEPDSVVHRLPRRFAGRLTVPFSQRLEVQARKSETELRAALRESTKEEAAGKGKTLRSGREALRWLETR